MRKGRVNRTMRQKLHAQSRALQRFGAMVTHRELKVLSSQVRGVGQYVRPGSDGREIWHIVVRGTSAYVVYDPVRRHIVTFYRPLECRICDREIAHGDLCDWCWDLVDLVDDVFGLKEAAHESCG